MNISSNPILNGTLSIREINGSYGPFKVGTLETPIGKFSVKDPVLDQYEPGSYEGEFEIELIFQGHYIAGNRSVSEIRARLGNINIADIDEKEPEAPATEPDPIETDTPKTEPDKKTEKKDNAETEVVKTSSSDSDKGDEKLFCLLLPLGETVKLDPSVERTVLRAQTTRLKGLGYRFDPKRQVWNKE